MMNIVSASGPRVLTFSRSSAHAHGVIVFFSSSFKYFLPLQVFRGGFKIQLIPSAPTERWAVGQRCITRLILICFTATPRSPGSGGFVAWYGAQVVRLPIVRIRRRTDRAAYGKLNTVYACVRMLVCVAYLHG